MQVIIQENQNIVWVTRQNKLYRVAPEHVRSLSAMEEFRNSPELAENNNQNPSSVIPSHGGVQFHNLTNTNPQDNHQNQIPTDASSDRANIEPHQVPADVGPIPSIASQSDPNIDQLQAHEQPDGEPEAPSTPADSQQERSENIQDLNRRAIDTPVPETSDEETGLYVEEEDCFVLQEHQGYRFEVNINQRDIDHWKEETRPSDMAFLVSAAKRQRSEVKISNLSASERKMFENAKEKEINSWIATETVSKILRHQVPQENILRCRWILTWKDVDNAETSNSDRTMNPMVNKVPNRQVPKARLVVLGFEDPLVDQIPRDSPTMSKLSRVLIMQHAASMKWAIHSFDIKTAFLRGTEESTRVLGMEPPQEMREKMKLGPNEIVRLLKGAYGRVDAPFLWFRELKQSLEQLGFCSAPFDPCTFVLRDSQQRTEGLIGIHVDDGLCCGSARFHQKLAKLERKYPFGSKKSRDFTFTGLKITQKDDYSIWVNQDQYVKDIHPINISKDRKNTPNESVTELERQGLRALVGSLQYAATNTRPDLCSRLGYLQSHINKAKISTLLEANKILHEAKIQSNVTIKIQSIPINDLRFVAFSDASFASAKTLDSHQGMIIMASHKSIGENQNCSVNPIIWHSKKIQRVVVSTLSAEAMSLAGAVDILSWTRLYWAWLRDGNFKWQMADEEMLKLPPAFAAIPPTDDQKSTTTPLPVQDILKKLNPKAQSIITTDCKSLYDLISRHAPPSCQEFRTLLQAKLIKEHINNGIQIRWVPSQAQLADALTKIMDPSVLRECLSIGRYSLHDEAQILRERSDSRARLQWLRNMTHGSRGEQASEWRKSQVVFHFCLFAWKIQMGTKWTWEIFLFHPIHLEHFYRRERITKCCLFEMFPTVMLPAVSCYLPAADGEGSGVPAEGGIHRLGAIGGKAADHLVQGIIQRFGVVRQYLVGDKDFIHQ